MNNAYLEVIALVERLHRHFLEVVKLELEGLGIHDINNVQGMMLFNIGDAEMTVGELTLRGCYLGSNVSYNLKKLVENDYVEQARSPHDRRSVHVRLTAKGRLLRDQLAAMHRCRAGLPGRKQGASPSWSAARPKSSPALSRYWPQWAGRSSMPARPATAKRQRSATT